MLTNTSTNKAGFKDAIKQVGARTKEKIGKSANKVKQHGRKYKEDIRTAYNVGYSKGWDYAYEIPNRFGAKLASSIGYRKGVKNRKKADKYIKQYNKQAMPIRMEG